MREERPACPEARSTAGEGRVRRVAAAAALGIMLASASCSRAPEAPLTVPGTGGEYCSEYPDGGQLTFGAGDPTNRASDPVRIVDVELADRDGMKLLGTRVLLLPTGGATDSIGVLSGWPPDLSDDPALRSSFAAAPEATGTTIPPSGEAVPSFVIGVETMPGASAGPIKVTYEQDDHTWTWTGKITFRVAAEGESC